MLLDESWSFCSTSKSSFWGLRAKINPSPVKLAYFREHFSQESATNLKFDTICFSAKATAWVDRSKWNIQLIKLTTLRAETLRSS